MMGVGTGDFAEGLEMPCGSFLCLHAQKGKGLDTGGLTPGAKALRGLGSREAAMLVGLYTPIP